MKNIYHDQNIYRGELMLRPVEQSDISAIESIVTDPGITMMLDFPKRHYKEARTFVDWAARQWHYPVPKDRIFVIIRSDQIVGLIDLETLEEPDVFEIGWLLRPDRRNQGIATGAAQMLTEYGFEKLHATKLTAHCDCRNVPSEKVMQKLGMKRTGEPGKRIYPRTGQQAFEYTYERMAETNTVR